MTYTYQLYPTIQPTDYAQLKIVNPYKSSLVFVRFTIRQVDNVTATPSGEELFVLTIRQVTFPLIRMFNDVSFDVNLCPILGQYQILDDIMQYPYSANVTLAYSYIVDNVSGGLLWFYIAGGSTKTYLHNAFTLTAGISIISKQ